MLNGKAGLITGAADGVGRATAIACAREGASVIVNDLPGRRADGEETVRVVREAGGWAEFVPADVTVAAEVEALVASCAETFGSVDFAFNNAGILATGFTADVVEKDFDRIMDVDVKGVWLCMTYDLLHMKRTAEGPSSTPPPRAGSSGPRSPVPTSPPSTP